jgi:hypothetical protein
MSETARRDRFITCTFLSLSLAACELSLFGLSPKSAQAQTNIAEAATKTCAVMSGERKLDRQTLQYLLLLDNDLADANPVALALYRQVIKQCPKAYLSYQQRKRASNPFPPGSLVKGEPSQLTKSPSTSHSDFPLRCHGRQGMASAQGRELTVEFEKGTQPADQSLGPGQCSWLDRGLRPGEGTHIVDERSSSDEARRAADRINAGAIWTFWVHASGQSFSSTASAEGTASERPQGTGDRK